MSDAERIADLEQQLSATRLKLAVAKIALEAALPVMDYVGMVDGAADLDETERAVELAREALAAIQP